MAVDTQKKRMAAFNYSDPFDDLLPFVDGAIDASDRKHLWGVYFLPNSLLNILDENVYIFDNPPSVNIDHETGDFSQYDVSPASGSIVQPGLNNTNNKFEITIPNVGEAKKNISISSSILTVEWWMDVSGISITAGGTLGLQINKAFATVVSTAFLFNPSTVTMVYTDDTGPTIPGGVAISLAPHLYKIVLIRSSGGPATDGSLELFIDDVSKIVAPNLDIDAQFDAITRIVVGNNNVTGSGNASFDEIKVFDGVAGAIYILGLIRILLETLNISEVILRIRGFVKLIAETINLFLVGTSNLLIDHETGDFSQYDSPPECGSISQPGLNFTAYAAQIEATSVIPGIFSFAAPTGTRFEILFYLDLSCFTTVFSDILFQGTTDVLGIRITDGGGNEVLRTEILSTDGLPTGLRAVLTDDNVTETAISAATTRLDTHQYQIILYKATTAASNDGIFEFYADGILQGSSVIQDLFNNWANLTDLEIGIIDLPGMDGHILIDEIAINTLSNTAIYILNTTVSKIIVETLNLVESVLSFPNFIIKLVADVVNISETVLNVFTLLLKIIADTLNISETILNVKGLIKVLVETININEVIIRILGLFRFIADIVNISETKINLLGRLKVINSTINLSETIIKPYSYLKVLAEVLNISETRLRFMSLVRVIVDGLAISIQDRRLRVISWIRIHADGVNVSEIINLPIKGFVRLVVETLNISETILNLLGAVKVIVEIVNVSENIIKLRSLVRNIIETVSITEAKQRIFSFVRLLGETLYIVEAILGVKALIRIISSSLNISGIVIKVFGRIRLIAETVNISETSFLIHGFNKIVSEIINISEIILQSTSILKFVSETLNISEGILKFRSLIQVLNDSLLISEAIKRVRGLMRLSNDSLNIVEAIFRPKVITRIEEETVEVAESTSKFLLLYLISEAVKKTGVAIGDTLRGTNLYQLGRYGVQILLNKRGIEIDD